MKIAITGASGFVGSSLSKYFIEKGYKVVKLPHIIFEDNSVEDFESLLEDTDVFINLAGETIFGRWTESKKTRIYNSRIETTRKLVKEINELKNKPKLLISASAIGYYKQGIVVDEDSPADGENFLSKVCFDWEKEAKKVSNEVKPVILRFGLILGDSGGIISNFLKFLKKGIKVKFGSGEQMMS